MKKIIIRLFVILMLLQMTVTGKTVYAEVQGKNKGPYFGTCEVFNGVTICYSDDVKEAVERYRAEQEAKAAEEARLAAEKAAAEEAARKAEAEAKAAEEAARLAAEEQARKAEAEKLAREKAEEEARIKAQKDAEEKARLEAEANKVKDNGHGYTKEEVHNNASGYKKDISTVSTKKANVNGNQLDEELQKQIEDELFKLMNETRAKVNSQALTRTNLNAETWVDMMLETGLFEHAKLFDEYKYEGKTKVIIKEVAAGVGDNWSSAGENIAWRSYAPDQLAATYLNSQWNKSTGHYNNRINSAWKYYDISVVKGEDGQWYAVERFAR